MKCVSVPRFCGAGAKRTDNRSNSFVIEPKVGVVHGGPQGPVYERGLYTCMSMHACSCMCTTPVHTRGPGAHRGQHPPSVQSQMNLSDCRFSSPPPRRNAEQKRTSQPEFTQKRSPIFQKSDSEIGDDVTPIFKTLTPRVSRGSKF